MYVIVRSEGLAATMSRYLIRRIETTSNIELLTCTEVVGLEGDESLQTIRWRDFKMNHEVTRPVRHLFLFIGATPNTEFLPSTIVTDANGFVCTSGDVEKLGRADRRALERTPHLLETSRPGVFAAGDVRATSTKRVAPAVGEGSAVVQFVHQLIATYQS